MKKEKMNIQGLKSEQDQVRAKSALHDVWGVREIELNAERGTIIVSYDQKAASPTDFVQALIDEGFQIGGSS